jgi:hypothetical protein
MAIIAALVAVPFALGMLSLLSTPPSGSGYPIANADPRFARCGGSQDNALAAFPMAHAWDFSAHFPYALYTPELQTDAPAFAVVYAGTYPGPIMPALLSTSASPHPERTLGPNQHDICVWTGDAATGDHQIYGNVDTTDMTATVPPTDGPRLPVIRAAPQFEVCADATDSVMTAFPMPHASDLRAHLPNVPSASELETDVPAFVVVFAASDGADRHDVCVAVGEPGHEERHTYASVDVTGLTP